MGRPTLVLPVEDVSAPRDRALAQVRALVPELRLIAVVDPGVEVPQADRVVEVPVGAGLGARVRAGLAGTTSDVVGWLRPGTADPVSVAVGLERAARYGGRRWLVKGQPYGRPAAAAWASVREAVRDGWREGRLLWDPRAQPVLVVRDVLEEMGDLPGDDHFDAAVLARAVADPTVTVLRIPARAWGR